MKWNSIWIHKLWTAVTSTPDEPHPPSQPEVVDRDRTFIELKWEPPTNDGGSPITGYDIERKDPKSSRWVKINKAPLQVSFFLCVCVCVCLCVHACVHVCLCVCVCVCVFLFCYFWGGLEGGVGGGGVCFVLISFHVHHAKLFHGFELTHTHLKKLILIFSNHRNILKLCLW